MTTRAIGGVAAVLCAAAAVIWGWIGRQVHAW